MVCCKLTEGLSYSNTFQNGEQRYGHQGGSYIRHHIPEVDDVSGGCVLCVKGWWSEWRQARCYASADKEWHFTVFLK